jgi:hypothetical protein
MNLEKILEVFIPAMPYLTSIIVFIDEHGSIRVQASLEKDGEKFHRTVVVYALGRNRMSAGLRASYSWYPWGPQRSIKDIVHQLEQSFTYAIQYRYEAIVEDEKKIPVRKERHNALVGALENVFHGSSEV